MKKKIAIIDDEHYIFDRWKEALGKEADVFTYDDPDEFVGTLGSDKHYNKSLDLIIMDRYMPGNDLIKIKFAECCRLFGYTGPIILSSSSVRKGQKYEHIDAAIGKKPRCWKELMKLLPEKK